LVQRKSRTIGRSFRINEQWLNTLNEEAEKAGISPNALLNKILEDYSKYQRYFKRFDGIALTQKSFSRIVEACSKEALVNIATKSQATVLDVFRTIGLRYNYEDATFFMTTILSEYANWFKCEHHLVNNKEYFHLRHNLGEKWSIYLAEAVSVLFEYCCNIRVKKEFLEGAVTLEIPSSRQSNR
jgi:hypothetical protein